MESILETLKDERIFKAKIIDKKFVKITEMCDDYFSVTLNKEKFGALIHELIVVYGKLED